MEIICMLFPLLISYYDYVVIIADAFPVDALFTKHRYKCLLEFSQNRRPLTNERSTNISTRCTLSDCDETIKTPKFMIREAEEQDLGAASIILADSFSINLNFLTKRVERMNTYLTLKSRFETFRYAERSGALQCMLVAYASAGNNEIVGFCEVDNRPPGGEINPAPRPYISNLAVRNDFRRMGVATDLVGRSEEIVRVWGEKSLHLCVKQTNAAAKAMYQDRCKYIEIPSRRHTNSKGEIFLLLGKTL